MNNLALIPKYTMYILQNQNIRHRVLGTRVEKNNEVPKAHTIDNNDDTDNNDHDDNDEDNIQNNNPIDAPMSTTNVGDLNHSSFILPEQSTSSSIENANIESYDSGTSNMLEL